MCTHATRLVQRCDVRYGTSRICDMPAQRRLAPGSRTEATGRHHERAVAAAVATALAQRTPAPSRRLSPDDYPRRWSRNVSISYVDAARAPSGRPCHLTTQHCKRRNQDRPPLKFDRHGGSALCSHLLRTSFTVGGEGGGDGATACAALPFAPSLSLLPTGLFFPENTYRCLSFFFTHSSLFRRIHVYAGSPETSSLSQN